MKTNLNRQYPYTGNYYSYVIITSADGTVTTKQYTTFPIEVKMDLSVNLNNTTGTIGDLIINSQYKMQFEGYLKNIVDRNGDEIYQDGVWEIISNMPVLNAFGIKDGYRYMAKLIDGVI